MIIRLHVEDTWDEYTREQAVDVLLDVAREMEEGKWHGKIDVLNKRIGEWSLDLDMEPPK